MSVRFVVLVWLLLGATRTAQTRYVSDRAIVELRRGPSTEYLILRNLESGEAVEVLEQNNANGYSRVRVLDEDTEGWVLSRFLSAEPSARERLAAAERNLSTARARVTELEQQVAALGGQLEQHARPISSEPATKHGQVSQELADIETAAANVVEMRDQNQSLRQGLTQSDEQVQQLDLENGRSRGEQSELVSRRRRRPVRRHRDRSRRT